MKNKLIIISILTALLLTLGGFAYILKTPSFVAPPDSPLALHKGKVFYLPDVSISTTTVNVPTVPLSTTPQETTWKTYTDEKYGFEFQYPPSHRIGKIKTDGPERVQIGNSIMLRSTESNDKRAIYIYLSLMKDIGYNPSAISLEDYETDYGGWYAKTVIRSSERVQVNNAEAVRQWYSSGGLLYNVRQKKRVFGASGEYQNDNWFRYVFFDQKDNFIILKTSEASVDEYGKESWKIGTIISKELLDDIAKTFRFIE